MRYKIYIWCYQLCFSRLLDLEHCVEHVYLGLSQNVYNSEKFKHFISYLRQECITNKRDAINMFHNICDKNSLIECKLVAYALDQIVYHTLHE